MNLQRHANNVAFGIQWPDVRDWTAQEGGGLVRDEQGGSTSVAVFNAEVFRLQFHKRD